MHPVVTQRKPIHEIEIRCCPVDRSPMREQFNLAGEIDLVCESCGTIIYSDGAQYRRRAAKRNHDER